MSEVATMPQTEDKVACEICGKMVTTHKAGRAAHMRTHKSDPVASEKSDKVVDLSALNADEKAIMERALAAEENARRAPNIILSEDTSDGNMALVKLYAPECLDKTDAVGRVVEKAERHAFFSANSNLVKWASRGYVPKLGDNGKYVTNEGGDVLMTCDARIFEASQQRSQNESRAIVRNVEKDLNKTKVDGAEAGDNSDLRGTSLKVENEEIEL
jgi:hypothetical protein